MHRTYYYEFIEKYEYAKAVLDDGRPRELSLYFFFFEQALSSCFSDTTFTKGASYLRYLCNRYECSTGNLWTKTFYRSNVFFISMPSHEYNYKGYIPRLNLLFVRSLLFVFILKDSNVPRNRSLCKRSNLRVFGHVWFSENVDTTYFSPSI